MRAPAVIEAELRALLQRSTVLLGELMEAMATPAAKPAARPAVVRRPKYTLNGKPVFVSELAALAGCSVSAMEQRLFRGRMTPEEAVAAGLRKPRVAAPAAPSLPGRVPGSAVKAARPAPAGPMLASGAEVIVPAGVKRTVAPTPRGRYDVDLVVPVFSALRPGQYIDDDTAVARAYGDRR